MGAPKTDPDHLVDSIRQELTRLRRSVGGVGHNRRESESAIDTLLKGVDVVSTRLQSARTDMQNMVFSLCDALLVLDRHGHVVRANPLALEALSRSAEEVVGCAISDFVELEGALHLTLTRDVQSGYLREIAGDLLQPSFGGGVPDRMPAIFSITALEVGETGPRGYVLIARRDTRTHGAGPEQRSAIAHEAGAQLAELREALGKRSQRLAESETERRRLEEALHIAEDDLAALHEARERLTQQCSEADATQRRAMAAQMAEVREVEADAAQARQERRGLQQALQAAEARAVAAEGRLEAAEGRLEAAESSLEAAESSLEAAESSLGAAQSRAVAAARRADEIEVAAVPVADEALAMGPALDVIQQENERLHEELAVAESRALEAEEIALEALTRAEQSGDERWKLEVVAREIAEEKLDHTRLVSAERELTIESLKAAVETAEDHLLASQDDLALVRDDLITAESRLERLEAAADAARSDNEQLRDERDRLADVVAQTSADLKRVRGASEAERRDLIDQARRQDGEVEALKALLNEAVERVEDAETDLETAMGLAVAHEQESQRLAAENTRLRREGGAAAGTGRRGENPTENRAGRKDPLRRELALVKQRGQQSQINMMRAIERADEAKREANRLATELSRLKLELEGARRRTDLAAAEAALAGRRKVEELLAVAGETHRSDLERIGELEAQGRAIRQERDALKQRWEQVALGSVSSLDGQEAGAPLTSRHERPGRRRMVKTSDLIRQNGPGMLPPPMPMEPRGRGASQTTEH